MFYSFPRNVSAWNVSCEHLDLPRSGFLFQSYIFTLFVSLPFVLFFPLSSSSPQQPPLALSPPPLFTPASAPLCPPPLLLPRGLPTSAYTALIVSRLQSQERIYRNQRCQDVADLFNATIHRGHCVTKPKSIWLPFIT